MGICVACLASVSLRVAVLSPAVKFWKPTAAAGVSLALPAQLHYQQICSSLR